jgi:hypothetical protein
MVTLYFYVVVSYIKSQLYQKYTNIHEGALIHKYNVTSAGFILFYMEQELASERLFYDQW